MTMKYIKKSALNNGFTDPIIDIDFSDCSQMKIDYNGLRGTNNAYNSGTEFIAMNESNNPEKFLMYNKKNYKKNYESYSLTFRIENINVYIRVKEFNIDYKNKMNQMDKKFDETRENKPKDIEEDLLNSYFDDSDILSQKEIDSLEEEIERMKLEGMELKLSTLIKRARIPYEKENVAKIWVKKNHDYFTDLILDSKSVTDSSSRRSERLDAAGQDLLEYLDDEFNPSHDSLESLKEQLKIYLSDYRSNFDPNLVFYVTEHFEEIFNEVFGKEFEVIEESNSDDIY